MPLRLPHPHAQAQSCKFWKVLCEAAGVRCIGKDARFQKAREGQYWGRWQRAWEGLAVPDRQATAGCLEDGTPRTDMHIKGSREALGELDGALGPPSSGRSWECRCRSICWKNYDPAKLALGSLVLQINGGWHS